MDQKEIKVNQDVMVFLDFVARKVNEERRESLEYRCWHTVIVILKRLLRPVLPGHLDHLDLLERPGRQACQPNPRSVHLVHLVLVEQTDVLVNVVHRVKKESVVSPECQVHADLQEPLEDRR